MDCPGVILTKTIRDDNCFAIGLEEAISERERAGLGFPPNGAHVLPGVIFRSKPTSFARQISENAVMSSRALKSLKVDFSEMATTIVAGIGPSIEAQKKILVIDDDPVTVKALTIGLKGMGYAVYSAVNGSEAASIVREENPDMMLVDVCLEPDMASGGMNPWDGFQVIRWLQHVSAKKIPAIIISATDKADYRKYAAMVGAETFMAKPLNPVILFQSIESALEGSRVV